MGDEWEVMGVVWQKTPVAAIAIVEELRARKQWTLATVRTLLRRLMNKGALAHRWAGLGPQPDGIGPKPLGSRRGADVARVSEALAGH